MKKFHFVNQEDQTDIIEVSAPDIWAAHRKAFDLEKIYHFKPREVEPTVYLRGVEVKNRIEAIWGLRPFVDIFPDIDDKLLNETQFVVEEWLQENTPVFPEPPTPSKGWVGLLGALEKIEKAFYGLKTEELSEKIDNKICEDAYLPW